MADSEALISLQGIDKRFGSIKAVDNVSFGVRRGEFFSLLGPSGCGKTTLLRMLAGFETPTAGEIFIDGQPMANVPPNKRSTNMVFQNYAIFPHLTVAENIAYGLRHKLISRAELALTVERALRSIKLEGYADRYAHQLSGGQRQRVALARALVCRPKVLLLDEPLGALDKRLREEMQIELRQLQKQVGVTFILVTHDQEEALALSDRIAVMSRGKVLQIDNATDLYESPTCKEVAEFIGSMNFIDGVVTAIVNAHAIIDAGELGTHRVPCGNARVSGGLQVTIGVRPEKIRLEREAPVFSVNAIEGLIQAESYFGDRSHYQVEIPGTGRRIAVGQQNLARAHELSGAQGRTVWLTWAAESAILLPRE